MFKPALIALCAAILLTFPAHAELSKNPSTQPAGTYEIDPYHMSVIWRVNHMGLANYVARFDDVKATITFDPANINASKVTAQAAAKSVNTGYDVMDKKLQNADFFDSEKSPIISFESTTLEKTTDNTGKMNGDLTLRGVTKPVTFDVVFNGGMYNQYVNGHVMGFSARTMIKRSDFGMSYGIPNVADEVEIIIDAEFVKKAPQAQDKQ